MTAIKREEFIGNQRLILGDCLEVMKELNPVDHAIFDPPYEQSLHDSKNSLRGRIRTDKGPDLEGLNFSGIDNIRDEVVSAGERLCNGWFIAFCTIEGVAKWADAINESKMKYKRGCIWIKPDSTPQLNGQGPAQGGECFVTAWHGQGHAKWNAGGKRGVYTHCVNTNRYGGHPTEKPLPLMMEILNDFTNHGQTVLDPFMGSGTTIVACERMGRRGIGIEMNEEYFNLACKRVEEATSQADMFSHVDLVKPKQEELF